MQIRADQHLIVLQRQVAATRNSCMWRRPLRYSSRWYQSLSKGIWERVKAIADEQVHKQTIFDMEVSAFMQDNSWDCIWLVNSASSSRPLMIYVGIHFARSWKQKKMARCPDTVAQTDQALPNGLQVTSSNFSAALPVVREALKGCTFFAFDCEMTGLKLDDRPGEYYDLVEERYSHVGRV